MEDSRMLQKIAELEGKNAELSSRLEQALNAIGTLQRKVETLEQVKSPPNMEGIKKWTCEYVESVMDDIHPLKDRYESVGYLPEYGGCIGYIYREPRTPYSGQPKKPYIHYNRSEVMKVPEISLS